MFVNQPGGAVRLVTHAAVRLYPSKTDGSDWLAVNLVSCVRFRCSKTATALLIAFMDSGELEATCVGLASRYGLDKKLLDKGIEQLRLHDLLVPPDDPQHLRFSDLFETWAKFGWVDSADYHVATLNYPFADYSADGRAIDFQRMVDYVKDEPDLERTKAFSDPIAHIPAPTAAEVLAELNEPFLNLWKGDPALGPLSRSRCLSLLSAVFGQLRSRKLADDPNLMADAISKTSPSGGARHPTESYLFAAAVEGLEPGVYHYNVANSSLDLVAEFDGSRSNLLALFSGPMRASFEVGAVIVMTSIFERSMYRYREPRSFRAIYMDVGHICGTMDVVAKSLRLNCLVQHGVNDQAIAAMLNLDPLKEGIIYGAAIGGARVSSESAHRPMPVDAVSA